MSSEISIYNDPTEVAAYLDALRVGTQDRELEELSQEADIFKVMPKMTLGKETKEIRAIQNEETVADWTPRNPLYFCVMSFTEARALWRPESAPETDSRFPVCSTARMPIGTFRKGNDRGVGIWNAKENRDVLGPSGPWNDDDYAEGEWPTDMKVDCATCPMNEFKSMREWDTQRGGEGKGKACGEGRLIVGYACHKVAEIEGGISIFSFDPNATMMYMHVSSTGISAVKGMGTACVARQIPPRYSVFQLGSDPQVSGQMKWGVLTQQFAGFIEQRLLSAADDSSNKMRDMIVVDQVGPDVHDLTQSAEDRRDSAEMQANSGRPSVIPPVAEVAEEDVPF
tara:strand:- start:1543 stop:2562 length:1020 start_codon:yes stop_codon:yes gene_type:complete